MKVELAGDPALEAELGSIAALCGETVDEMTRQAIREELAWVAMKHSRQRVRHDLALHRDVLRGELQVTEAIICKMEEGEWLP